jgi:AcrR family transcriptional regulator
MSPQPSNRDALVEGALRCLERLPPERVTARAIADEAAANLASIPYHFGSKDELVTEAAILGLDRWLEEIDAAMEEGRGRSRLDLATDAMERTRRAHGGLARGFAAALVRGEHDPRLGVRLVEGFRATRPRVAELLALGTDQVGEDAAGLVHSMFVGLLLQQLLDENLGIEGARRERALARLGQAIASG